MTATVTLPAEIAQAAMQALRASGDDINADKIDRALNPPNVWVIRGPEDDESYGTYLGRDRYEMRFGRYQSDPLTAPYLFGSGGDADLFTDAEKDTFDGEQVIARMDLDMAADALDMTRPSDDETGAARDAVIAALSEYLLGEGVQWEQAPTEADGHDAFASGNTELDFCENLTALGSRADQMRATV